MPVEVGTQGMSEVGEKKERRVGYSHRDKIGQTERHRQPNSNLSGQDDHQMTTVPRPTSTVTRNPIIARPDPLQYMLCISPEVVRGRRPWRHSNFSVLSIMDHLTLHAPPGFDSRRARLPI